MKEIICRDEENVQIITNVNSSNPMAIKVACSSGTNDEKPIIASIDSTKEARICVACRNEQGFGHLTVFGPPEGSHWAPARGIWNQYNYHVLNINDDGTVPQFQENNATYQDGRYNNFNMQASTLDEDGNMLSPAAQLTGDIACVDFDAATETYTVTFDLYNLDDASLAADAGMNVSFYDGDPSVDGDLLGTYETLQSIARDESLIGLSYSFSASTLTRLFMAVNTDGVSPLNDEDYNILECDYTDNISQYISLPTITSSTGTVCDGSVYDFYGMSLSAPGNYYHDIDDTQGCDSVVVALLLTEDCGTGCEPIDTSLCYIQNGFSEVNLQVEKLWESAHESVDITPLIIDVDDDCIPEILSISDSRVQVVVSDGKDGSVKSTVDIHGGIEMVVADIDRDGEIEIIVRMFDISLVDPLYRGRLVSYNMDSSINWVSSEKYDSEILSRNSESLALADFNKDGIPEVYLLNEIYNALTGVKILDGGNNGKGLNFLFGKSIAAELDGDDSNLELAAGYTIYQVDITNVAGESGNTMTAYNMTVNGALKDGPTIVADVNGDGNLDVIVASRRSTFNLGVYAYNYNNGAPQIVAEINNPDINSSALTGCPTVFKNIDLDTMFIAFAVADSIECYYYEAGFFNKIWTLPFTDLQATNGLVAYDLDNDGMTEIVCRDEENVQIITNVHSNNPTAIKFACRSGTADEKPIVAAIDSTHEARVCVVCRNELGEAYLTVFGPPEGSHWAPARGIWNQYNYHVLNINDDGTVPQFQENNATYQDGRYNNFNVQASTLDEDGNMLSPAAQLTGDIVCVDFDAATETYTVTFDLYNLDDASLAADVGMSVSFYDGDPSVDGDLLGTYETLQSIARDESLIGLSYSFSASTLTRLFMAVNTDGSSPLNDEDYDILECDYTDNISQYIALPTIVEVMGSVCNGSVYEFYGMSFSLPGTYYHTEDSQDGCDSFLAELILEVRDTILVSLDMTVRDTFMFAQDTLLASGDYQYEDVSTNGCDSITQLSLTILSSSSSMSTIVSCDNLVWNGTTYDSSDTYIYNTVNAQGCDSTATIALTINRSDSIAIQLQSCESYDWNGINYTQSGIYYHTENNTMGCDSVTVLDLEINDVLNLTETIKICDSLRWNGTVFTESGMYNFDTISINDCDSIVMLDLEIFSSTELDTVAMVCDSFYWRNKIYYESGAYPFISQSMYGCDSTTVLQLEIIPSTSTTIEITQCESYEWNGQVYTTSGNYQYESANANACDSIANLQLTILTIDNEEAHLQVCDSLIWHNQLYTESGDYTFDTLNMAGCDSTLTLHLEVVESEVVMLNITACDSLFYEGDTLLEDGVYYYDLTNVLGCDSSIVLDLNISSEYMQESIMECDSLVWDINGATYRESGIYYESYTNTSGCDSIYELDLTIHQSYHIVEVIDACEFYLWSATNDILTNSGTYTDENVTAHGCDSISTLDLMIHPSYEIHDTVSATNEYYWEIDNTTYTQSGVYEYDLSTNQDCDSIQVLHLFLDFNIGIYTPNIISTNDPNSNFTVYGDQKISMIKKLYVFDRWGNLMAEKTNIAPSQPSLGWDATFKGQNVTPGVYIWMAELELLDGNSLTKYGDLTVVW